MAIETLETTTLTDTGDYWADAITDGYVYQCSCGELYSDKLAAYSCRKCRKYCVFGRCTHVVDIKTGKVVMGTEPTKEAYEEARVAAEAQWAEEKAELERWLQMRNEEGPLYEAEMQRREEAARAAAAEAKLASEWAIQDRLMGR